MILITGASGNVGHEVVKQALSVGLTIRASFQSPDTAAKAPAGLEGVIMNYSKPETIRTALHGVKKIFLVSPAVRDLPAFEANFVKEVSRTGRKHIVKLSALGGRESMFPSLHRESEEQLEASGLPYTFLRPNAFMQNLVTYHAGTIGSQNAFYGCQRNGAVSLVDVRGIAVDVPSSESAEFLDHTVTWYQRVVAEREIASSPNDAVFVNDNARVRDQIVRLAFEFARSEVQSARRGDIPFLLRAFTPVGVWLGRPRFT